MPGSFFYFYFNVGSEAQTRVLILALLSPTELPPQPSNSIFSSVETSHSFPTVAAPFRVPSTVYNGFSFLRSSSRLVFGGFFFWGGAAFCFGLVGWFVFGCSFGFRVLLTESCKVIYHCSIAIAHVRSTMPQMHPRS